MEVRNVGGRERRLLRGLQFCRRMLDPKPTDCFPSFISPVDCWQKKRNLTSDIYTIYTFFFFFFLQRWWENPSVQLRAMEWTKRLKTALREITLLIWSNAENDSRLLLLDKKKPFYSRRNNDSSLWGAESEVISCYKNLSERKRSRWRIGCTKRVTPTGPCWFYSPTMMPIFPKICPWSFYDLNVHHVQKTLQRLRSSHTGHFENTDKQHITATEVNLQLLTAKCQ